MEILWICLGACGIALVVFLIKKFVPSLDSNEEKKNEDTSKDDDEYVVPFEENTLVKSDEETEKNEEK